VVPHGTCDSVCIGGFSMGGGWGPWTRRQGMCCEHIVEATMVLGDGSITTARMDGNPAERELLWAIKGGGGFSYGIVTELVIQTFELPWEMYRFSITWNPDNRYSPDPTQADRANAATDATADAANGTPTLHILRAWEQAICRTDGEGGRQLAGTNLKIYAKPLESDASFDPETIRHGCVMYGYWEGDKSSLERFIKAMASATGTPEGSYTSRIGEPAGRKHQQQEGHQYGAMLMNDWHQISRHELAALGLRKPAPPEARNDDIPVAQGTPYKPDLETPEGHKITSRLVNACGLGSAGHARLLASLTSPLLDDENLAFPYKEHLYAIQYQTWWVLPSDGQIHHEDSLDSTARLLNRALDWMQECRDYAIPNTSGAFISFKDSSIPTSRYFDKNYTRLIRIKQTRSQDPNNLFRSRKTII